jgi:hypothetical protein
MVIYYFNIMEVVIPNNLKLVNVMELQKYLELH